jgi:hypothetical protein
VERTLVALGLVLAALGAMVAVNGYVYVNVERGPPMMVSGVLLFGFGLVLAALGFILRQLQAISADAAKTALLLAKSRNGAVPAESIATAPSPAKPLPPLAPFEPPPAAPVASEPEPRVAEAQSDLFAPPAEDKTRRPVLSPALAPRPEESPKSVAPALPPLSWMRPPEKPESKLDEDDWLNRAIAAEADKAALTAREDKDRPQNARREIVHEEKEWDETRASSAREADQALRREFGVNDPPEEDRPSDLGSQPKPEVIGNYEAHGAHYTMYADGSIEAETQHGVYRFASIEELKRFIEGEEAGDRGKS